MAATKKTDAEAIEQEAAKPAVVSVKIVFTEEVLGTSPNDTELYSRFIASKAPDAPLREEEIDAIGVEALEERGMTVFSHMEDGTPYLYDYQVKGFFKDSCKILKKSGIAPKSAAMKAYKQDIDGLVFPSPRRIALYMPLDKDSTICQRPLRASTPQGERVALSSSEALPAGTWCEFKVELVKASLKGALVEWLDYGRYRGIGQWRNSGKGRFVYELRDEEGKVVSSNLDRMGDELV